MVSRLFVRVMAVVVSVGLVGCSSDEPEQTVGDAGAPPCRHVAGSACSETYVGTCACAPSQLAIPSDVVVACCRGGRIELSHCVDGIYASTMCNPPDAGAPGDADAASEGGDTGAAGASDASDASDAASD
ncbi:MAG: hypothetical protein HYV09_21750 [Deltaproteobacteria bacterium]|nr:hypothetical protein [Deltaproteobacteria bacterium]